MSRPSSFLVVVPWRLRGRGYLTGILSDQTEWLDRLDAQDHLYRLSDRVYNSYYLGTGKRDPSLFTEAAADLGLPPSAILLVDDTAANVARATSAGMRAVRYVDPESLRNALETIA